ncbi:protein kinase [Streptomyces sp. CB03911]|uniref:protein kinase domain-containing protein n=1 Tax=Streptomyces sp. CB03911 TaxID=1804758 RepID=UPI00093D8ECB|nr:protein kinase [Streptomyces sp. CB03911]OKI11802.1 serine/threonine protein kinase [Streptomyces sp. CB03911]
MAQTQQPGDGEGDGAAGRDEAAREATAPTAAIPASAAGPHTPGRGSTAPLGTVGDGRYRLTHRLGRGGMAEVLAAQDVRLGRTVAVKLLRPELAQDDIARLRFNREAQSVAGLNHHSIVAVYDTGEEQHGSGGPDGGGESTPYIVMELVEGRTVRELLVDEEAPPVDQALIIIAGVLEALAYSHRHGIVHRDIKPANVIITTGGAVKVMDFGIARALTGAASTMTQTGMVMGTPQYLSPEQALGKAVDHRSDLYAAGCMLYELLTLRPPFTGDTPLSVVYQHVQDAPVPPSQANHRVPAGLDALVLRSLAKNPDDRFQDADEFRAHVQHALRQLHGAAGAGYPGAAAAAAAAGLAAAGQGHSGAFPGPGTGGYGQGTPPGGGTAITESFGPMGQGDPTAALPYQTGSPYQTPSGPYQGPGGPNGGNGDGDDDDRRRGPWGWVAGVVAVLVAAGIGIAVAVQAGNNDHGNTPIAPAVTTTSAPEVTQGSPSAQPSPSATKQTQAPSDNQTFVQTSAPTRHSTPSPTLSPSATATKSPTATASPTSSGSATSTGGATPTSTGSAHPPVTSAPPVTPPVVGG